MRILIVGPISSPIIRRLEKSLRGSGLEVFVASYNVGDFSADNIIDLGRLKSFVSYLNFFKINRLVRKLNPDLVHAHVLNHYGLMCAFQPKPLLVALWGSEVMVTPKKGRMIKRFLFRVINEFVLCRADGVHSSSQHIIDEVTKLQKSAVMKAQSFYWGFPLVAPSEIKLKGIEGHLQNEFGISGCGFIVFPRGISEIYNPRLTVEIAKGLLKNGVKNKIIIFKGFSSENDELSFSKLLSGLDVYYVNRLLDEDELYSIYTRCDFHFSNPKSDSLGGGVVEPAQLGSIPVLNDIPPYQKYLESNEGILLRDYDEEGIARLSNLIKDKGSRASTLPENFSLTGVVTSFKDMFNKILANYE